MKYIIEKPILFRLEMCLQFFWFRLLKGKKKSGITHAINKLLQQQQEKKEKNNENELLLGSNK